MNIQTQDVVFLDKIEVTKILHQLEKEITEQRHSTPKK
jgi:hypothetical protein